jgi:NAD+ kinase
MKIKKALVVINPAKPDSKSIAKELRAVLDSQGVAQQWVETLAPKSGAFRQLDDLCECEADIALVCGGDGTLLQTAHRLKGTGIPLLGINIGYLGFMTAIGTPALGAQLRRVLRGEFQISERLALDVSVFTGRRVIHGWALNDVLIARGANPHLISVSGKVGAKPLTQYRCDGLLVATPTGSTAYTLSAGGPIISPECEAFVITPICPQALTSRSVVVGKERMIEMELDDNSGAGEVQADGMKLCSIQRKQRVVIRASEATVPLAFLPEVDFFDSLVHKLRWHGQGVPTPRYFRA